MSLSIAEARLLLEGSKPKEIFSVLADVCVEIWDAALGEDSLGTRGVMYDASMPVEQVPVRNLWLQGWSGFIAFAIVILFDTARGALLFAGLLLFAWLLSLGKAIGVKPEYVEAFESVHAWANIGVFGALGLSFFINMLKGIFRGE